MQKPRAAPSALQNNRFAVLDGPLLCPSAVPGTRSILIVEDEPLIAKGVEDFLHPLGHQVSGSCDTVTCGLEEVEKGRFDLAILNGG